MKKYNKTKNKHRWVIKNTGINFYLQNKKNVSFGLSLKKNQFTLVFRNYRNIDFVVNKGSL